MTEEIKDVEVDQESLNIAATSRLMHDLSVIKNSAYNQGIMHGALLVEVKIAVQNTLQRYQQYGFFLGETIKVTLDKPKSRDGFKYANIRLTYSDGLKAEVDKVMALLIEEQRKRSEEKKVSDTEGDAAFVGEE